MEVIRVENLSKLYDLGQVGTGTVSKDLNRWWARVRGQEDPYARIGQVNDRTKMASKADSVWALKDINFSVQQGEVVGIIGRNGAGKSTLLKIISRITTPTTGTVKIKGRIASLLEVGTGFHPEMTGRENIFMNGTLLGMTRREVQTKMDQIIDFAGVALYIDTPVKRYSSGMQVRLAFAVAAFLEPEILIVDEVLAVGDAEFQKKAIGRMKDVSRGDGRTVLFVSHNMTAVKSLCSSCIYVSNGEIKSKGETEKIVNQYLSKESTSKTNVEWKQGENPGDDVAILHSAKLIDELGNKIEFVEIAKSVGIEFKYEVLKEGFLPIPNVHVFTSNGECAFVSAEKQEIRLSLVGVYTTIMWIPSNLLNEGTYIVRVALSTLNPVRVHFWDSDTLIFDVIEDLRNRTNDFNQRIPGIVRPHLNWHTVQLK